MEVSSSNSTYTNYTTSNNRSNNKSATSDEENNAILYSHLTQQARDRDEFEHYIEHIRSDRKDEEFTYQSSLTYENIIQRQKKYMEELDRDYTEKMSNPDLIEGVTYDPQTKEYTYIQHDNVGSFYSKSKYSEYKSNGTTKIVSEEPITQEYLEERFEKIQNFFKTEYLDLSRKYSSKEITLDDMGLSLGPFSQRDIFGIVRIDGQYMDIDPDEYRKHYEINRSNRNIAEQAQLGREVEESLAANLYYRELHGIKPSYENAEEFQHYVEEWSNIKDSVHFNDIYRQMSLAVNLGLIDQGDQDLFSDLHQTDKATNTFRYLENDVLKQATLDAIGSRHSVTMERMMYENIFNEDFQNRLNTFATELQNNPEKYPSTNSDFTFDGDITVDENSSEEYKDFITNTLIDFFDKEMHEYVEKTVGPEGDPYVQDSLGLKLWDVYSYRYVLDNLKDSLVNEGI